MIETHFEPGRCNTLLLKPRNKCPFMKVCQRQAAKCTCICLSVCLCITKWRKGYHDGEAGRIQFAQLNEDGSVIHQRVRWLGQLKYIAEQNLPRQGRKRMSSLLRPLPKTARTYLCDNVVHRKMLQPFSKKDQLSCTAPHKHTRKQTDTRGCCQLVGSKRLAHRHLADHCFLLLLSDSMVQRTNSSVRNRLMESIGGNS